MEARISVWYGAGGNDKENIFMLVCRLHTSNTFQFADPWYGHIVRHQYSNPPSHPPPCAWILYTYEPICHYVPQPRHECGIATLQCCWGATWTLPDLWTHHVTHTCITYMSRLYATSYRLNCVLLLAHQTLNFNKGGCFSLFLIPQNLITFTSSAH